MKTLDAQVDELFERLFPKWKSQFTFDQVTETRALIRQHFDYLIRGIISKVESEFESYKDSGYAREALKQILYSDKDSGYAREQTIQGEKL